MTVKLIKHTGECNHEDDPGMPFKLELILRAPEFMAVAFVCIYGGSEDVVARADTQGELVVWMTEHGLDTHARLSRYRITGPEGVVAKHRWG